MGLKHSKEVREALPKQVAESINGTSKTTAKCNCSPCNCSPCKCPEKSCTNAKNGSCSNGTVSEEAKPCQEPKLEEGGNSQVVVTDEIKKSISQCHDDEPEVNADEVAQKDPNVEEPKQESTPPRRDDDQPTPEAEVKPVVEKVATSPVTSAEEAEQTNITQESTTQAEGEQAVAVSGSSEQPQS